MRCSGKTMLQLSTAPLGAIYVVAGINEVMSTKKKANSIGRHDITVVAFSPLNETARGINAPFVFDHWALSSMSLEQIQDVSSMLTVHCPAAMPKLDPHNKPRKTTGYYPKISVEHSGQLVKGS